MPSPRALQPAELPQYAEGQYRVFVSYSHGDRDLVLKIVDALRANGLEPMWDMNFAFGTGFHDEIKSFIAHAHVFLPVITAASNERNWVHQEIGYAMAQNIPVLPVTVQTRPGEMLQQLHAVVIDEKPQRLEQILAKEVFENLVSRYRDPTLAQYQCAELTEDRARLLADYADQVTALRASGMVRQKGALSSLHIPSKLITDSIWKTRYGENPQGPFHCRELRKERLALEEHVRRSGCRLIVNPETNYDKYGEEARIVRLQSLVDFLKSKRDSRGDPNEMANVAEVAFNTNMEAEVSVTIVGDWFAAEAVSARIGQGYRQTIFTRHAPSMQSKIDLFDQEFDELLKKDEWTPQNSRRQAIERLESLIADLEAKLRGDSAA